MADELTFRRVVWITGAAGGLGRHLVDAFHAQGDRVVATFHRGHDFQTDDRLWPLAVDVTQSSMVEDARQAVLRRWSRIDVLINNAGVTADALVPRLSEADWGKVLDVNLRGAFLCCQAVLPAMIKQREGHIVNLSSFAAKRGHAGQSNYVAAKAGLIGLTQSLAQEVGSRNIRINAILPGVLPTSMTEGLSEPQRESLIRANALRRLNDIAEVARFILFLTTLKNVSGQVFQLDSRISPWT